MSLRKALNLRTVLNNHLSNAAYKKHWRASKVRSMTTGVSPAYQTALPRSCLRPPWALAADEIWQALPLEVL